MEKILSETIHLLESGLEVVWATVVENKGSAPRGVASRMAIASNGKLVGSVGGGRLEAEVIETARELHEKPGTRLLQIFLTGQDVAEINMICGGTMKIFLETLVSEDIPFIKSLEKKLRDNDEVLLVTMVGNSDNVPNKRRLIIRGDQSDSGFNSVPDAAIPNIETAVNNGVIPALNDSEEGGFQYFIESIKKAERLYIFGAGHVSLEIAWVAHRSGFQIVVWDDRKDFANSERFPMAIDFFIDPCGETIEKIKPGPNDYVVIVTRGHLDDLEVLRKIIAEQPQYIGMIGSRRKRDMIFEALIKEGVSRKRIDDVYAPIGLDIKAQTPAELAVSIVAELILVRAQVNER